MRIVSWNILQGGGKRAQSICDAISNWTPDILVLQEYRHGRTSQIISGALHDLGLVDQHSTESPARKNCVFIASGQPLQCQPWTDDLDATLALRVTSDEQIPGLDLLAAHLPHKREQVPYLESLLDQSDLLAGSALIIGDLNCGIPFEDSDTKTFSNTHLFQALLKQGWIDSWRSRHPDRQEFTWISHRGNGYRYDHCLSSPDFDSRLTAVEYDHVVREDGLSDHSALILDVDTSAS